MLLVISRLSHTVRVLVHLVGGLVFIIFALSAFIIEPDDHEWWTLHTVALRATHRQLQVIRRTHTSTNNCVLFVTWTLSLHSVSAGNLLEIWKFFRKLSDIVPWRLSPTWQMILVLKLFIVCVLSHHWKTPNSKPGAKFTNDLRTILRQFSDLWQLANSPNIYDSRKTYLKTTSYNRLLDVLRQLAQFGFPDRPIVLRFKTSYDHHMTS